MTTFTPLKILADTNVTITARDGRHPQRQARCAAWLSRLAGTGVLMISPQVASEHQAVAVRKLGESAADAAKATAALLEYCTRGTEPQDVRRALDIQLRWRTSWWDGLLLAWAVNAGCSHLLTEDSQSAPSIEGVRLIDPFLTTPDDILSVRR